MYTNYGLWTRWIIIWKIRLWCEWSEPIKIVIMHWEQREQRKKNVSSRKKGSLFGCLCVGDSELCEWQ